MKRRLTLKDEQNEPTSGGDGLMARIVSSSVGAVITSVVVTPLEVAKVRLQNIIPGQKNSPLCFTCDCGTLVWKEGSRRKLSSWARLQSEHPAPGNTLQVLRQIYGAEGVQGLYRGLRPTLVMAVPNTMLYYTCYDELVQKLRANFLPAHLHGYAPLISGGGARLLASSATAPLEYLRTHHASSSSSTTLSLGQILRSREGVRTLFRGFAPTLWRDVPFSAIYWVGIEEMRRVWRQRDGLPVSVSQEFTQSFVNGFVAGSIAACCTTPFDVVKTRQQATTTTLSSARNCHHHGATPFGPNNAGSPQGTLQALRHVARTEGMAGLWRGNTARVAKVAPSCAIMIASYEVGKRLLLAESP